MYRGSSFGGERKSPYRFGSKDSDSGKGEDSQSSTASNKSSRSDSDFSSGERSPSTYKTTSTIMLSRHESDRTTSGSNGSAGSLASKFSAGSTPKYVPLNERLKNLRGSNQNLNGSDLGSSRSSGLSSSGIRDRASLKDFSLKVNGDESAEGISSSRREAREAFLRGETQTPKVDPNLRSEPREPRESREHHKDLLERDKANQKERMTTKDGPKEIEGYVGFANLPNQVYRKSVKKGFEFTLMVVGESGLGKSTLINSMFLTDMYSAEHPGPSHRIKKTVQVDQQEVMLKEGGVQLRLTVVDTPGFGDAVDNSNCWSPVIEYIESKCDEYLNAESRVNRKSMPDNRVHCCLYFISPNGHGLKPLDVEFMKRLHDKVNIIPLIAKADTLTPDECREFKKTILNEIAQHKIRIYEFPDCDDEEENKALKRLKDRVPYAVIGANTVVESGGKKVRGRVYPWGIVEVENLEHNDFIALRNMLIRTHMQDLKDVTNNVHYENFRYNKLASVSSNGKSKGPGGGNATSSTPVPAARRKKVNRSPSSPSPSTDSSPSVGVQRAFSLSGSEENIHVLYNLLKSPLLQMEEEKKDHVQKMKKMEAEMEQVFEMKVKEKRQKLKDSETDLQRRAEQMKKSLDQQEKDLENQKRQFEKEKESWEDQQRTLEEQRRSLDNANKAQKKKSLF